MIEDEERFDPAHHSLDDAAKRLKQIAEKDYTARLAEVLGRHEERKHEEENVRELLDAYNAEQGGFEQVWIRTLIREEVHRALYPTAEMANPHEHRRIEMTEEDGKKWRGVLYAVEDEQ